MSLARVPIFISVFLDSLKSFAKIEISLFTGRGQNRYETNIRASDQSKWLRNGNPKYCLSIIEGF